MSHPFHRRIWAEELVRRRRGDERLRYAASQRRGRIDANPHQIDAVLFALRKIRDGGCILADEVGLGKTIEAGLVVAQLLAEGARRILFVLPKALLGQWKSELYNLFGLDSREGGPDPSRFQGDGIFVVGREFAGSERGASILKAVEPFDLCIIDEAHEIFAGIYKRYQRDGVYDPESGEARMAQRVRGALGRTPVLLLTATPIQNNLTELWGLVQYVEPTGTLLGSIATFRDLFCEPGASDRLLVAGQADELRRRINTVCQRTLRRQAQEFLERKFTVRRARLLEYEMSQAERSLHDDVTDYLLEPDLNAFRGSQRRLLLISFLRQMASSWKALAASLENVARRLRAMMAGSAADEEQASRSLVDDLEEDDAPEEGDEAGPPATRPTLEAELARVEAFIERARSLPGDAKARALLDAVRTVLAREKTGQGSGKVVIFTESLTTQEYIRKLLVEERLAEDREITLFRGVNDSPRALEAGRAWREEVEHLIPSANRPSREVAIRMALVHEFKTRSRVFISTESGAKGLNLQFCDTLVNYDLPWNPQRIEQRIGRCHRYSQERDVTVINFLAKDNEAQRLTFQILSEKLELFGQVLDATDAVLHEPTGKAPETIATALGAEFEGELRRIWERARSQDEVSGDLRRLSDTLEGQRKRFEETQQKTASLIESRFDDSVRVVFRKIQSEIPQSLAELDQQIERVVTGFLTAEGISFERREHEGRVLLTLSPHAALPEELRGGGTVAIGHARQLEDVDPLHLGHPLLLAAVENARTKSAVLDSNSSIRFRPTSPALVALRGQSGRMIVARLGHAGFEPFERILFVAVIEGGSALSNDLARELALSPAEDAASAAKPPPDALRRELDDALDEAVFEDQVEAGEREQSLFRASLDQIERYMEDQVLLLRRRLADLDDKLEGAEQSREAAVGPDARQRALEALKRFDKERDEVSQRLGRFEARDDQDYRAWRQTALDRRAQTPTVTRLLEFSFEVE